MTKTKKKFPDFTKTVNKLNKQISKTKTKSKTTKKTLYKKTKSKPKKTLEFDSGLNIIDKPRITLDYRLLMHCDKIQSKFKGLEFSVLCKGHYDENGFFVTGEYIIPKQRVSSGSVEYEDLLKYEKDGYNVVIHSHHNLGSFFSKTDLDYINSSFPCSVLYNKDGFTRATLSFKTDDNIFVFETDKIAMVLGISETIDGIENIEEEPKTTWFNKKTKDKEKETKKQQNNVFELVELDKNDDKEDDDGSLIVKYLDDGVHCIVNGIKMTIDQYEICLGCGCHNKDLCTWCLEEENPEEIKMLKAG